MAFMLAVLVANLSLASFCWVMNARAKERMVQTNARITEAETILRATERQLAMTKAACENPGSVRAIAFAVRNRAQ
jgi:hypothetical protein